jgi:hypothetical protein
LSVAPADVPRIVTFDVPVVAVAEAVKVNVALAPVVGLVVNAAVTPEGRPSAARVIAFAKLVRVIFTTTDPLPLCAIDSDAGVSASENVLAAAAVTVSVKVADTELTPAPLPVPVRVYVPVGTVDATDNEAVMVVVAPLV